MAEIKGMEIFRVGRWTDSSGRTDTWTREDLEKIAARFDAQEQAPLVLGHPKEASAPAYGWVTRVWVEGKRLLADVAKVPEQLITALKEGWYRKRSISLSPDMRLRHVGLLGAAAPAVAGLRDIALSSGEGDATYEFSTKEEGPMKTDLERAQARIAELEAELATMKAGGEFKEQLAAKDKEIAKAKAEAKAAEEAKAKAEKEFGEYKAKALTAAREARFEALVKAGKALPADKPKTMAFAEALGKADAKIEFSDGQGKTEEVSTEEAYWRELENREPHGLFSEFASKAQAATGKDGEAAAFDINDRV
jgi:hypothetical protein